MRLLQVPSESGLREDQKPRLGSKSEEFARKGVEGQYDRPIEGERRILSIVL